MKHHCYFNSHKLYEFLESVVKLLIAYIRDYFIRDYFSGKSMVIFKIRQLGVAALLLLQIVVATSITDNRLQAQDYLRANDISQIMKQIFSEHVDKKEITGKILQSSLRIYIDQFDPQRIYLLESEVTPFLHITPSQLEQLTEEYKSNNFSEFEQLNKVIQFSIERSRKIRKELEAKIKNSFFSPDPGQEPFTSNKKMVPFAHTEEQLRERILENFGSYLEEQKKFLGKTVIPQFKKQIVDSYEIKLRDFENQYLYQNRDGQPLPTLEKDHLFAIHVLKALANSLDSHTTFYQANEAYDIRLRLQKEFRGIGLVLKDSRNGIVVTHMLAGGPAEKSKLIEIGDILLEVDTTSIINHSFEKVMQMLHGEKNTQVKLSFKRKGTNGKPDAIYTVELRRELIIINNDRVDVSSESFGHGIIGKITLHSFYQGDGISSEKDVREAIEKLQKQGNLRGLILDLRENSGGFLSQAVQVAGLFITNGVIVISKYANGEERFYRDVAGKQAYDGPLIILTSKVTASAAEIVAQALQDYGVALIVGDEHTYGKGTIQAQTITDNQNASYFKVTVGKYYTVSGKTPQKNGVLADIISPSHWNHEHIGENYMDSVDADTIHPSFNDQLADISAKDRPWYLKYYIPTMQHRTTLWHDLLPILQKNSQYRIAHNKNYQYFLKGANPEESSLGEEESWEMPIKNTTIGEDDLQMQEAINILKDMILLSRIKMNDISKQPF